MSENNSTSSNSGSNLNGIEQQFRSLNLKESKPEASWRIFSREFLKKIREEEKVILNSKLGWNVNNEFKMCSFFVSA